MRKIIVAIDGYSSCGKSTFAKAIAKELEYAFIDTGAMYRAVTLYAIRKNIINDSEEIVKELPHIDIDFRYNPNLQRSEVFLLGENIDALIRSAKVNDNVSKVSQISEVRDKLVLLQQKMGKERGIVMDGRDIGTVVFPDAELKIFMTADPKVRAMRRFKELNGRMTLDEVEQNLQERDYLDENRAISPLKKADDAILLDNSRMTVDDQMTWVRGLLDTILGK